jgi:hypothetical protein
LLLTCFSAREERFPFDDAACTKELEADTYYEHDFEDDLVFGGFWYINFHNLQQKNLELVDDMERVARKNRSNSF